jgi:uncharacterized protein
MPTSTADKIRDIFANLAVHHKQAAFADYVSDNVDWRIMGHSPFSRTYHSREDYFNGTIKVLSTRLLREPLRLRVTNVFVSNDWGGEEINADAVVEMEAIDARCKDGMTYDASYCWVCGFEQGKIKRVRAYIDTKLLCDAMARNP